MDKIIEKLQQKIINIMSERDSLENKYYSDKRNLETKYSIETSLLLTQKVYLQGLLKDIMETMINKD